MSFDISDIFVTPLLCTKCTLKDIGVGWKEVWPEVSAIIILYLRLAKK